MGKFSEFFTQYMPFLRWWLMFTASCVGFYFAYDTGLVHSFLEKDSTNISLLIFSIFVLFTFIIGYDTYKASKKLTNNICARAKTGWFFSDALMTLGMLGTVIGFIMMLNGDITAAKAALTSMSKGMGIALYTTAAGVTCGLLLKIQLFNLSICIDEFEEETANKTCGCSKE
jgi:hypothetical protein